MYYKSFDILIKRRFSKFLFFNKFYSLGNEQNLGGGIRPSSKFLLIKLNISITKGKEKYF